MPTAARTQIVARVTGKVALRLGEADYFGLINIGGFTLCGDGQLAMHFRPH